MTPAYKNVFESFVNGNFQQMARQFYNLNFKTKFIQEMVNNGLEYEALMIIKKYYDLKGQ